MEQQKKLALWGRLDGPAVAPVALIQLAQTYRQAVRLAWAYKRVHYATHSQLAGETGMPAQHVTDYLNKDDAPRRRDLPAHRIPAFEAFVGNTIVSQWLALQAQLTVLEELQASKLAA